MLCALLLNGCASIFCGTQKTIAFSSEPEGAHVFVDGEFVGTTPISHEVDSSRGHSVRMRSPGYQESWAGLSTEPRIGMIALDFLLTLGIGLYVDLATGAATTIEEDTVHRVLAPIGTETTPQGAPLYQWTPTYADPVPVIVLPLPPAGYGTEAPAPAPPPVYEPAPPPVYQPAPPPLAPQPSP